MLTPTTDASPTSTTSSVAPTPPASGSSAWTTYTELARNVAGRIEAGTTWINQHGWVAAEIPQAGAKASGIGVESGPWGLDDLCQIHVVNTAA